MQITSDSHIKYTCNHKHMLSRDGFINLYTIILYDINPQIVVSHHGQVV